MSIVSLVKAIWSSLLAIVTVIGGIALFFVDPVRSWTRHHGAAGWAVTIVLLAGVLAILNLWLASCAALKSAEDKSAKEIDERDTALTDNRRLTADAQRLERELENRCAQLEISEASLAETRRQPTERDKAMFAAVIHAFPRDGELYIWLDSVFSAKSWRAKDVNSLQDVLRAISEHKMVDDVELADPLDSLKEAINHLLDWMALNGEGNDHANAQERSTDPTWSYRAYEGNDLKRMGTGGWPESDRVRDEGAARAKRILGKREEFERVGRACRL